jgi:hypothetical protein
MSDNARPEPEQAKPVEPGPVEARPEGSGSEPPASSPTELLILPTDVDEPPIYFEPDAVAPFLPAASLPPRGPDRTPANGTPTFGRRVPEPAQVVLSDIPWEPASRPPAAIEAAFAATIPAPSPSAAGAPSAAGPTVSQVPVTLPLATALEATAPVATVPEATAPSTLEEGRPSDPDVVVESEPNWSSVPPVETAPATPVLEAPVPTTPALEAVEAAPPEAAPLEAAPPAEEPAEAPAAASAPEPPVASSEPDTLVSPLEPTASVSVGGVSVEGGAPALPRSELRCRSKRGRWKPSPQRATRSFCPRRSVH